MGTYRISIFLSVFFLSMAVSYGQHQNDNWYFGQSSAIRFNGGKAEVNYDNPNIDSSTTSVSISDPNTGKLIFYSNGKNIRDGKHEIIRDSIVGDRIAHEMIALPHPSLDSSYYLFLLTEKAPITFTPILAYLIIDLMPDGSIKIENDIEIIGSGDISEMSAVRNCNTNGYWLVTYNSNYSAFITYEVGHSIAKIPRQSPLYANYETTSRLISNNTGEYFAIGMTNKGTSDVSVQIFRIDKNCGLLSPNRTLDLSDNKTINGLSFSDNSKFLYVSCSDDSSWVIQFDLESNSSSIIYTSKNKLSQMKMGPNGKLYISSIEPLMPSTWIDVINNPNEKGTNCDYNPNLLDLGSGSYTNSNLPNFYQDTTITFCPSHLYEFKIDDVCEGQAIKVELLNAANVSFVSWTLYGRISMVAVPDFRPIPIGEYELTFVQASCLYLDTLTYKVNVRPGEEIELGKDTTICSGDTILLEAKSSDSLTYFWPSSGHTDPSILVSDSGKIKVIATNINGCISRDSINIHLRPELWSELESEYYICEQDSELIQLDAGKGFDNYLWHPTGDTSQWIKVSKADSYFVVLSDFRGCEGNDHTLVKNLCDGYLFFPNAFSPNGDGTNDSFSIQGAYINSFHLQVFNRWGELIFESQDLSDSWDGTFNGQNCPQDPYFWVCSYRAVYKKEFNKIFLSSGRINLVR